ncbi:MAG: hypothetical protein A3C66_00170 [Candidatus Magasanikbacteria bacterium RIFCSPHIGHO2_02_FULL_41_35]|nr:MAG: hypothetical protein A3C66_00170 [Candidatus Magasanikbacteria bacterium RIFCSPHIGHO2_02_FULL_41_35]
MSSRISHNNPKSSEALGLPYHYEMVSDSKRVVPFRMAIKKVCKGKRVLESGAGSAILSILAAKAGATKVYAIEIDKEIARFARENIRKNCLQDKIVLIESDVLKIKLSDIDNEPVDVVIAENLSTWQVTEPQIVIMNHINESLIKKRGIRLPEVIYNYVELAYSPYNFENVIDLRTYFFLFTGIKKPVLFSERILFEELNLSKKNKINFDKKIRIHATKDGTINSLKLTSPLQIYHNINFDASDSLMPPVVVPLDDDLRVKKSDIVELEISYKMHTHWDLFKCKGRVVNSFTN